MTERRFTKAQESALRFLDPNGAWLVNPPRFIAAAIYSLGLSHRDLVEDEQMRGPRSGHRRCVRLTPTGQAERRRLEAAS